ncbi:cell wall-binding repeat-containing protein [Ornithinimicrobium sp. F0845]|uniref:cell wall-binding repeat-containing protein n=1 Tax=Ornithinimicrobium sp. F0845 TaxID=2926412 RepID=UPI001FF125E4|nr:cell wall-binding repeat-containing protein [Ornithinimicrobium sp. F0845]MCK0111991.1 cell wall-binding repeat-containing protein [Ornithinimicrobium sp. F0845]
MSPRRLGAALLAVALAVGMAAPALADPAIPGDPAVDGQPVVAPADDHAPLAAPVLTLPVDRLGGVSRYETATKISASIFSSADTVYLARADIFADAIAAGSLTDGPVLLVPQCGHVPAVVTAEVNRLDPTEVIALGGAGSVCDSTLEQAAGGRETHRLDGTDRFDTAALIAARAFPDGSETVYLAEHRNSVDAVAGGTLTDGPILLVQNGSTAVPQRTREAIEALDPTEVVALGGSSVVTDQALAAAAGPRHTDRVSGSNRYATAAAIAERAFPQGSSRTYLANGSSVADAVVGGALTRGPILLVPGDCRVITEPAWRRLSTHPPEKVVALGGKGAVCTEQLQTGGRLGVFSGMESDDTGRLYDLLTKQLTVSPLRYVPPDLLSWRGTSHRLRPETAQMLEAMFDGAAGADRGGLYVTSAFRSYETQQDTYAYWVSVYGEEKASMLSAKPGHSEHQLGLAVDIAGPTCGGNCFGTSPEGKWVAANAHRYGFIIRYPEGGTSVTGYYYEPWHLRYVGPRAAWMMHVRDQAYWDSYQPVAVAESIL